MSASSKACDKDLKISSNNNSNSAQQVEERTKKMAASSTQEEREQRRPLPTEGGATQDATVTQRENQEQHDRYVKDFLTHYFRSTSSGSTSNKSAGTATANASVSSSFQLPDIDMLLRSRQMSLSSIPPSPPPLPPPELKSRQSSISASYFLSCNPSVGDLLKSVDAFIDKHGFNHKNSSDSKATTSGGGGDGDDGSGIGSMIEQFHNEHPQFKSSDWGFVYEPNHVDVDTRAVFDSDEGNTNGKSNSRQAASSSLPGLKSRGGGGGRCFADKFKSSDWKPQYENTHVDVDPTSVFTSENTADATASSDNNDDNKTRENGTTEPTAAAAAAVKVKGGGTDWNALFMSSLPPPAAGGGGSIEKEKPKKASSPAPAPAATKNGGVGSVIESLSAVASAMPFLPVPPTTTTTAKTKQLQQEQQQQAENQIAPPLSLSSSSLLQQPITLSNMSMPSLQDATSLSVPEVGAVVKLDEEVGGDSEEEVQAASRSSRGRSNSTKNKNKQPSSGGRKRKAAGASTAASKKKSNAGNKRSKKDPEVKVYYEPTDFDVLLGRGGRTNHHPGNKKYLEEKADIQERYMAASKEEKTGISQELVDRIHAKGGRFLELDKGNQKWFEVTNLKARKKASQTLRELNTAEERAAKRQRYGR